MEFRYAGYVNYRTCDPYSAGQVIWKYKARKVTYAGGVDAGPINVSAQSGWNVATKIGWEIARKTKICGSSSDG